MSEWKRIEIEVCAAPEEGDPVQNVSIYILEWEQICRVYGIDKSKLALVYQRDVS